MFIKSYNFLTAEDIKATYQKLPPLLYEELIATLKMSRHDYKGVPVYSERLVDETLHALVVGVAARKKAVASQDGPAQPDRFVVHGISYKGFTSLQMHMLFSLWGNEGNKIENVKDDLYGHNNNKTDNALKTVKNRLNKKLIEDHCPAEITSCNGCYSLKIYPRPK